jgi:prepilin-type N-terminal cleavage/methylation domain-containing protein
MNKICCPFSVGKITFHQWLKIPLAAQLTKTIPFFFKGKIMKTLNNRKAFTLVELLVVVVIIGILSSLVTVGVMSAVQAAKRSRIAMEMHQITLALEKYKSEFGEYPPDMYDNAAIVRHVKKRWPRFIIPPKPASYTYGDDDAQYQAMSIRQAMTNIYKNQTVYPNKLLQEWTGTEYPNINLMPMHTNIQSLAFWLGGVASPDGRFVGFGADPYAPFGRRADNSVNVGQGGTLGGQYTDVILGTPDKKSFLELEVGKNAAFPGEMDGSFPCIVSQVGRDKFVPFIYFRGNSSGSSLAYSHIHITYNKRVVKACNFYKYSQSNSQKWIHWGDFGTVTPYAQSGDPFAASPTDVVWFNSETYQLIHSGLDTKFGKKFQENYNPPTQTPFSDEYFRSINMDAAQNTIGQYDFDNITNFSDCLQIKSILP